VAKMQTKVVTMKELTEDNPTLCLSPLRVFDQCHKCERFKRWQKQRGIKRLKCKPHLNDKYFELQNRKRALLDKLNDINKEIEGLST